MNNAFKKMTRALAWITAVTMSVWMVAPTAAAVTVYKYEWVRQSGTISADGLAHEYQGVIAGQTIPLSLTILNRSGVTIKGKSALPEAVGKQVPIGVWGVGSQTPNQDGTPSFLDLSSFVLNNNRFVYYDGADVPNGGEIVFNWNIKMSSTLSNGTYKLYVRPVSEYLAWTRQVKNGYTLPSYNSDIFWQFVVGTGVSTTPTGGLSIALSPGTPASQSMAAGGNANMTKITLTAASGATVKISQIYVLRDGLSASSDVENVQLLKADGTQVGGTAGGFNADNRAQIFITPAYALTGSEDFYLRAGLISTITAGKTIRLGIATNDAIISNATSVTGAPVYGNYMSAVSVTIGTITVSKDGSVVDSKPDVGSKGVVLNTFKIEAGSTEGVTIDRITVMHAGTTEYADTNNIELWDVTNNVSLGKVDSWTSDGKASWPVNIVLGKGENRRLSVKNDILDGVALTINCDIADGTSYLVYGKGNTYGFYITPTAAAAANWVIDSGTGGTANLGQGDKNQTINSGALVITKSASTPATGNVSVGDNQLLTVWDFDTRGEQQRISATTVHLEITRVAGTPDYADLTGGKLVDMATGNLLAGPLDAVVSGATTYVSSATIDGRCQFTDTFVLPVGVTKVGFKVKIGTDFLGTDTVAALIGAASLVTDKGLTTNNSITPTLSSGTGNTLTVKSGAIDIAVLGVPATGSLVINSQNIIIGTYAFNAVASGEDVRVSSFTLTDTMDGTTATLDDFTKMELWADLTSATSSRGDVFETKISNTMTPATAAAAASATQAFTFTQTITVPKGTSINVAVVASVSAAAATHTTAFGTHIIEAAASPTVGLVVNAVGATTGSTITETTSGLGLNATLTMAAAGSVTTALASANPDAMIVIAGVATPATLAAFRLTATNEPLNVTKLTFDLTDGYDSLSSLKISYPTKTGTASREIAPNAAAVVFDNIDMYIPKNGSATVTVSGNAKRIQSGAGGVFDDSIIVILDMDADAEFAASGESSGAALTGGSAGTTNRTASTHILYNSVPTVTKANPSGSGTIQPGSTIDLYKFTVTADAAGEIAIKKFNFVVFITDASTTTASAADLSSFTFLRDGTDITTAAQITDITTAAPVTLEATNFIENNTSTTVQVAFGQTPAGDTEQMISAGQTVTYTLRALCGTGFTTTDAISTSLSQDAAAQAASHTYLVDTDYTAAVEDVIGLTIATEHTGDVYNFIWSDRSTLAHAATFSETTSTPSSSGDWTNGYLVKNFPLSGYGYTL